MVQDPATALRALHLVLVAARNIGQADPRATVDIVDYVECLPMLILAEVDHTDHVVERLDLLAADYPECGMAAATARTMRTSR